MSLYPLDAKDVEAIGRSRANRNMPQSVKYWMYAGFVVFLVGLVYWNTGGGMKGLAVAFGGVLIVMYSTYLGGKVRDASIRKLKGEWRELRDREQRQDTRERQGAEKP